MAQGLAGADADAIVDVVQHSLEQALFLLDTTGRVLSWNDGAQRIKGYEPEEILGKNFRMFFTPEDVANHKPEYELKVAASAGRYHDQGWRLRKGGFPFWARVTLTARRGADGTLLGFVKLTEDATREKQVMDAMRASEERYRILVDSVRDYAIFLLDATGRVRTWNRGAEAIKGYAAAEIIGEPLSLFYTPEDRDRGRPHQLLARAAQEGRIEDEGWRVRKDGSRFWADVVITAIHAPDGTLTGFSKVTRDLTERHMAERERVRLERHATETSEANRQLESFSYSVAHDLRAPIRAVSILADQLAEDHADQLNAAARELVHRIGWTSERMGALVDDLLNFSRAEKGAIQPEAVDVGKMAQHILHNTLLRRDPDRVGHLDLDDDLTVWADRSLLRVVMDNLLGNAWKFTATRPRYHIRIQKRQSDHSDTLVVQDNGIGFPSDRAHEIFEPFRRLHDSRAFPGTGIGLATVERVVTRHGGRVWAESAPGEGTTLYLSFPRAADAATAHLRRKPDAREPPVSGRAMTSPKDSEATQVAGDEDFS